MVYRNTELALQWEETSRAAMTAENVEKGWFLRFKTQAACDAAAPCVISLCDFLPFFNRKCRTFP